MKRTARAATIAAAMLAFVSATACSGSSAAPTPATTPAASPTAYSAAHPFRVLVLGDSYSAGNGAGAYEPGNCYRSRLDYGGRIVTAVNRSLGKSTATLRIAACSGATTADLLHRNGKLPAQVTAVRRTDNLILLTITGNDANFSGIATHCLVALALSGSACDADLTNAEKLAGVGHGRSPATSTIATRLRNVLTAIRKRAAPHAVIGLLGYPFLIDSTAYTIAGGSSAPRVQVGARLHRLQVASDALDTAVVKRLDTTPGARIVFVSTQRLFAGPPSHSLSPTGTNKNAWLIAPFSTPLVTTWYHPDPTGWAHEASLLLHDRAELGIPG